MKLTLTILLSISAYYTGFYMGETKANEQLVELEKAGYIEPLYVDSAAPALWVKVN